MPNTPTESTQYFHIRLEADGPRLKGAPAQCLGQVDLPQAVQTTQDVFAEWRWDGSQVVVRNCRLGFFPLFYFATESEFGVAQTVEKLIECGAPSDLDDAALATFLRLGFVVGDDTFEKGRIEELSTQILNHWLTWRASEDVLKRIFTNESAQRFSKALATEHLAKELTKHASAPSPLVSFYFWNRERGVNALQAFAIARQSGVCAITPYLDHNLVDFLLSLPVSTYTHGTFHTETIHRMHPEFSDIPFAGSDSPLVESKWHYWRFVIEVGTYLAFKGKNQLINKKLTVRRLLALALNRGSDLRKRTRWIAPHIVLYLTQLEKLCPRG